MINLSMPKIDTEMKPRITVFGVGGAGGNAVNNMIRSNLEGVEFVVGNTDAQALNGSLAQRRIQLGSTITRGLGAGSRPDVGRAAAEEQIDEIAQHLDGTHMVFITCGMGGGTGTGAAPVIARCARERGILTVGVVTKPFHFEGAHRMRLAESGIAELQQFVDTLIIIPNQNLFRIANEKTTFADAFKMADDVLHSGVRGVTDLMVMPGLINLDFADIRSVMTEMGKAMMGTGEAGGERRAIQAAEAAISNPLLDDVSMKGARGVLINITGGYDMTLFEVDEAANRIRDEVDPDANIIFGSTFDPVLDGVMRVSVVATGIDAVAMAMPRQQPQAAVAPVVAAQMVAAAPPMPFGVPAQKRPATVGTTAPAVPTRPVDYHSSLVAAPLTTAPQMAAAAAPVVAPPPLRPELDDSDLTAFETAPGTAQANASAAAAVRAALGGERADPRASGPLRGERRDGQFIAPRPVDSGPRQPMTAADHGDDNRPRRRGPSLFERMTGLGWRGREDGEPEAAPRAAQAPGGRTQPTVQPTATKAPAAMPRAGEVERPKVVRNEDEMFDIPAFLRRQAN